MYGSFAIKSDFYQNKVSRLKLALVVLKKALKLDPKNYRAMTLLARVYITLGNVNKGEELLEQSLELNPSQEIAQALLPICQLATWKYKEISNMKNSKSSILLATVKAMVSYHYEREKKAFNAHYEKHKFIASVGTGDLSSDEELYDSDDDDDGSLGSGYPRKSVIDRNINPRSIAQVENGFDDSNRDSVVNPSEISLDLQTDRADGTKTIKYIEKAIKMCSDITELDGGSEITATLDMVQLEILKTQALIGLGMLKVAYDFFYATFPTQQKKAFSLDIFVLEAELLLKVDENYEKAKEILVNVIKQDTLHFKALILLSYINIFYEGMHE